MLKALSYVPASELDERVFAATVPEDHYLRLVKAAVNFDRCRDILAAAYCSDQGRPAVEPLLLLKLEFLEYHYNLSDRQVMEQSRYNMAFRWFLDLSLESPLPHHTLLTYFRERLGSQKHQAIFDEIVGQARRRGLVKDRLRLKDATHMIANIAIPSTIRLVSQIQERLLRALRPWDPAGVATAQGELIGLDRRTADLSADERLLQQVTHLRQLVTWAESVQQRPAFSEGKAVEPTAVEPSTVEPSTVEPSTVERTADEQKALTETLQLAHQILADREAGQETIRSLVDPDARRGKHGGWYDGYLLDAAVDADSGIITAMNVLSAHDNEGADVTTLLNHEEQVHGNDVQAVSIDGAGYQGPVLHELTKPGGLQVEVFVPPKAAKETSFFTPEQFTLDATKTTLTCPGGQTTTKRRRGWKDHGWSFTFRRPSCAACPLQAQCVEALPKGCVGRTVNKSDYEMEYAAAQAKAQTPEYVAVRRQHWAIERKLGELVRWHRARRARYWGQTRVLLQGLLTAVVVNVKRLVALTRPVLPDDGGGGTVRAGLVGQG